MENKRPPTNAQKPFNQTNKPYRRETERPFGTRNAQSRESNFSPRNDRSQSRNENFQPRGGKFQPREERFQPRDENFQPRGGKFLQRNDKFQPKGRFAPKAGNPKPWERDNSPRIVSEMQITDGKHKGKYLQSTASPNVRPTARRIREVMFRILFRRVRAGRFLDLCAGSGMVGIEAISRGAIIATFVERSAKMCSFIKKNLQSCGIKEGHGEVVEIEVMPFLKKMAKRRREWDVIYFDPPYDSNYDEVLNYFGKGTAIKPKGTLVIEHHAEMFFPETFGVMHRWRVLVQGETALSFYERK
ncbi:MAG: 16S rRNA (guanine(966)-N(2))-methyltransferase RsmD [Acidobacteriota bacterium]|nr:16S rRNA (guanine(966)-N(2))-methyltransferase RsmD [Acidobacteriota bacterium]